MSNWQTILYFPLTKEETRECGRGRKLPNRPSPFTFPLSSVLLLCSIFLVLFIININSLDMTLKWLMITNRPDFFFFFYLSSSVALLVKREKKSQTKRLLQQKGITENRGNPSHVHSPLCTVNIWHTLQQCRYQIVGEEALSAYRYLTVDSENHIKHQCFNNCWVMQHAVATCLNTYCTLYSSTTEPQ